MVTDLYLVKCATKQNVQGVYDEPTNVQLINNLLHYSLLHCPYMFRRHCFFFGELLLSTC
jgi:hypothetical protein